MRNPDREWRVLVVDDSPGIRGTIAQTLEDEGFPVCTAANGEQALQMIQDERPSLVLLDMGMPLLDGQEFVRAIRARGLNVPIVVMSASPDARAWAREVRARAFLPKPFDLDDLLCTVEEACGA